MPKPLYRAFNADADLPLMPPFRSLGMTCRYYPLPAELSQLQAFCDTYLNFQPTPESRGLPAEIGHFEPVLPFVFFIEAEHPRLVVDRDRYGWFSQREVTFGFPVEWYRQRNGRWEVAGSVFLNPFIYIDNSLGLTAGREVHGWPKEAATFRIPDPGQRDVSPGPQDETRARLLLQMETLAGTVYSDNTRLGFEKQVTLELEQLSAWNRNPIQTAFSASHELNGFLTSMAYAFQGVTSGRGWGASYAALWMDRWRRYLTPSRDSGIITLKQFWDPEQPTRADYQALIHSTMRIDRLNGSGLLGTEALLWGDISGGYRIRLHEHETMPIKALLGLHVDEEEPGASMLRPAFPFWINYDITYTAGEVLCWRSGGTSWNVGDQPESTDTGSERPRYVARGTATDMLTETSYEELEDVLTLHVLPLRAKREQVAALCARHFETGGLVTVEPVEEGWVYLVAATGYREENFGTQTADWKAQTLDFYIPVKCRTGDPLEGDALALFAPFSFTEDGISLLLEREMEGWNVALGELTGEWMDEGKDSLLTLETRLFRQLHQGEEARNAVLLEVQRRASETSSQSAPHPLKQLLTEGVSRTLHVVGFKQFRDAAQPERAAYQSVTWKPMEMEVKEVHEDSPVTVRIHTNSTFSLVPLLGLEATREVATEGGGAAHEFHSVQALSMQVRIQEKQGRVLCTRTEEGPWRVRAPKSPSHEAEQPGATDAS